MGKKHKAIMVYMDESDLAALAEVRKRLGATTNSGAIRAALRVIIQESPARGSIIGALMSKAVDTGEQVQVLLPSGQGGEATSDDKN